MTRAARSLVLERMPIGGVVVRHFFAASDCQRVRQAMDRGIAEDAEILAGNIGPDTDVRRASHIEIDAATLAWVEDRLDACRQPLADALQVRLADREGPSFLRYVTGGFYKAHRDRGVLASWPDAARRCVSLVLFLNSSRAELPDAEFDGGALRLHSDESASFDVHPSAGTLVAFSATMRHEVMIVSDGTRDAIVDWFYAAP